MFKKFQVYDSNIDESSSLLPLEHRAVHLALEKARSVTVGGKLVIGADTIVGMGDQSLGKPEGDANARDMLRRLSGGEHRVITGVAVLWPGGEHSFCEVTRVTFRPLTAEEIDLYVSTGEPQDKAGAYAIQGGARKFATRVDGDIDTVVGLPVARLTAELGRLGLIE
ncbi:MAG: Maf family protein [Armatimonadota bacterium]|nr:Maf family protein [Armatimonadota bacterium]